jgi:hypothetical protein
MLHKEWLFTRFAVHILHLYVYSRLVTPTLRAGLLSAQTHPVGYAPLALVLPSQFAGPLYRFRRS